MKIFLSALRKPFAEYFVSQGLTHFKWNLMSYYGLKRDEADYIKAHSDEVMIDSGHTLSSLVKKWTGWNTLKNMQSL